MHQECSAGRLDLVYPGNPGEIQNRLKRTPGMSSRLRTHRSSGSFRAIASITGNNPVISRIKFPIAGWLIADRTTRNIQAPSSLRSTDGCIPDMCLVPRSNAPKHRKPIINEHQRAILIGQQLQAALLNICYFYNLPGTSSQEKRCYMTLEAGVSMIRSWRMDCSIGR